MKLDIIMLRQIGILSVIIGLVIGALANLPFHIGSTIFILYFLALAAGVIIYLKRINVLGDITVKEGGIIGTIIGMTSFVGFCVSYMPMKIIVGVIKDNFLSSIITSGFTNFLAFTTLIMFLIFMDLLCALMNAFAGGVTAYIYELLEEYKKDNPSDFQTGLRYRNK